jgi:hypothetical protein
VIIIYLMFIHYICDFWLQTEKQARGKSGSLNRLLEHTIIYSIGMAVLSLVVFSLPKAIMFGLSCFVFHTITDYFTSRLAKNRYESGVVNGWNGFFSVIGLDQFLHFVQIYLTMVVLL